jgi:serine/threonine-protein kinase
MIELRTLGALELRYRGEPRPGGSALQSKRLVLLAYLAASPANGFRRRDTLLGLFWPELDQEHARGSLRQALHTMRKALGEGAIVTRGESEIGLDATLITTDARGLEAYLADGNPVEALSHYRGEFLEGVFVADASPELEEWIAAERIRLRRVASKAAWAAAEKPAGRGETGQYVRRAVLLSGADEAALRKGIALLDRMGDRAAAAALFEEFASRVARDLDVQPSAESQAAMRAVRERQ